MKKLIKGVILTISVLLIIGILFIGVLWYLIVYHITDIDKNVSPNDSYRVEFQAIGQAIGFGSQHCRLALFDDKNKIYTGELWIANDGKVLSEREWKVQWFDDRVEILIFGEEQRDELYIMFFDGTTKIEYPNTHYGKEIPSVKEDISLAEEKQDVDKTEIDSEEDSYVYRIEEGYHAIYAYLYKPTFREFVVNYGASMSSSSCILYENDENVEYLVYDRASKNGKCFLYVKYSVTKNVDGSWNTENSAIEDMYAYDLASGDVTRSGKKSWQDIGSEDFQNATGEY